MRSTTVAAIAAMILLGPAVPTRGQGCINTMCSGMMCTVTATAPAMTTGGGNYSNLKNYPAPMISMANCAPSMASSATDFVAPFSIVLMGTGTGSPASCSWPILAAKSVGGVASFTCRVDQMDGLPVELMDFSIEDDESE